MMELRIHGRGGQGAVTSAELLALALISEGKYALAFPSFGPERRGAPVQAFVRTNDKPVRIRTEVREPDIVVVLDAGLLEVVDVGSGLKKKGVIIVNSRKAPQEIKSNFRNKWRVAAVDATTIAREVIGVPIVNTTMLGAIIKVTDIVRLSSLEEPLKHRFRERGAGRNLEACQRAYEQTSIA
jgi:pyruvate ferredoxin oxidoreductase gamma subunit